MFLHQKLLALSFDKREVKYFHFRAGVSEGGGPISVGTCNSDYAGRNVHMLVQRGGEEEPPDVDDYELTKDLSVQTLNDGERDLFWDRGSEERVTIREPMDPRDFYVMLYNDSDEPVPEGQMLKIAWH